MKIPVWRTTLEIFDVMWNERGLIARYGMFPLLLTIAVSFTALALGIKTENPTRETALPLALLALTQLLVYLRLSVTWYRTIVLGETAAQGRPLFTLGRLELRFLLWQVLLGLAVGLFLAVAATVIGIIYFGAQAVGQKVAGMVSAVIFGVSAFVGALLIMARLSLVLVFAALGQPVKFKLSWLMTEGLGWRLLGVLALIALPMVVLGLLVKLVAFAIGPITAMVAGGSLKLIVPYFAVLGQCVIELLLVVAAATLFGIVFKLLTAQALNIPAGDAPASAPRPQ